MILRYFPILSLFFIVLSGSGCYYPHSLQDLAPVKPILSNRSIIRVNVTTQGYHFHRPWQKRQPSNRTAIGIIAPGSRVLVTSELIANHRYIELERIDNEKKTRAQVEVVDYEANLALLQPLEKNFLSDMQPLELEAEAKEGDILSVWQVKPNGNIIPGEGPITAIERISYLFGNSFIAYRLNSSLQYRGNNFTLPVIKDGKLAGLLMRYDAKAQTIDVIPAPVILHFLKDASDGIYDGFPLSGMKLSSTEDPVLREYLGLSDVEGGIMIERISNGAAAKKVELKQGDIILEIDGYPISSHGTYEHPVYGKISASHLIRCEHLVGDNLKLKILRNKTFETIELILEHRQAHEYLVPPYILDRSPRYYILGGLIFLELSTPYLAEYGKDWSSRAPTNLVYYQKNQDSLDVEAREKIVFLSNVIPTSFTSGYENLSNTVVKRINNLVPKKLEDIEEALKSPVNGFHKIELEEQPTFIYLDPKEIPAIDQQIKQVYRLPALKNLD